MERSRQQTEKKRGEEGQRRDAVKPSKPDPKEKARTAARATDRPGQEAREKEQGRSEGGKVALTSWTGSVE